MDGDGGIYNPSQWKGDRSHSRRLASHLPGISDIDLVGLFELVHGHDDHDTATRFTGPRLSNPTD